MKSGSRLSVGLLLALSSIACGSPVVTDGGADPDGGPSDSGARDTGADAGPTYPAECENVGPMECLLPWPSSRYIVEDATTASGYRVELPLGAMPMNGRHVPVDPEIFNRFDGFSPATSIITAFEGGDVDGTNLPDELHIADSLLDGSPTVLLRVEGTTVTRVAHFAEIDAGSGGVANRHAFYVRPAARLDPATRYVVAIRDLTHTGGGAVEPSAYFRALRDDTPFPEASDIETRRPAFEDIFTLLTGAGVERGSLVAAWDFRTASDESIYADMVSVRDQGLAALTADGSSCAVTMVEDMPETNVFRRVHGTVRVPLFIGGTEPSVDSDTLLVRDADGHPIRNATTPSADVPFVLVIPTSVAADLAAGEGPGRLLAYGHGLFGDRFETDSGWFRDTIEELHMVGVAVDWWGMSTDDVPRAIGTITELSRFPTTSERMNQGLLNFMAITRSLVMAGACQDLAELHVDGDLVFDPTERYYYGNSQGGIMGSALAGLSTDITHFAVGVAGMSYSIMIPRSVDGVAYNDLMLNSYSRNQLLTSLLWVMSQSQWDLSEPATYVPHVRGNPLPCALPECTGGVTPIHQVLFQIGLHDGQVPNVSSGISARSMRDAMGDTLPLLDDAAHASPFRPYGLTSVSGPVESALVVYEIPGTTPIPPGAHPPADDTPAHEGVRRSAAGHRQLDAFFHADGMVTQTCEGACDPD
jgi:hypothetical protein